MNKAFFTLFVLSAKLLFIKVQFRTAILSLALIPSIKTAVMCAEDAVALIKNLSSETESVRANAIVELHKMNGAAEAALWKSETSGALESRQLMLTRRLLGDLFIKKYSLEPFDFKTVKPFCQDLEAKIAGDSDLLINLEKKIIVLNGGFCLEQGPLEHLIVSKDSPNLHEAIVEVVNRPRDICYALLACEYTYAGELGDGDEIDLPQEAGVMISIQFLWEETHADMIPVAGQVSDQNALIVAIQQKNERIVNGINEADRARLLFDMESDVAILRKVIGSEIDRNDTVMNAHLDVIKNILKKESDVYDDARRLAMVTALHDFLKATLNNDDSKLKVPKPVDKKWVRLPLECFALNEKTELPMKRFPFIFTGSEPGRDPNTGKNILMADFEKFVLALKYEPHAVLNTPLDIRNIDPQHAEAFYALNRCLVPRRLTKCRIVFEPWTGGAIKDVK